MTTLDFKLPQTIFFSTKAEVFGQRWIPFYNVLLIKLSKMCGLDPFWTLIPYLALNFI
jgi:hypothetical protein